ncbi:hypothetical protein [Leifsonia sp. WHRI 6310E]|uniref:hypothetical protein n=1 Tax=Leifsonia sp. WHRI 6310E TaxID=3162562 RepID=UPI0032EE3C6A
MNDWPDNLDIGPIREWPGELTPAHHRQMSRFRVSDGGYTRKATPLSSTLWLLDRELRELGARDREMLVAIAPQDFRRDGKPRAQARAEHPGVILSFDTKYGPLSYAVDTFTTWQDNLRAIALGLEALRKVNRYGVTRHGEQYRGFLAIESATAMPAGFATGADAAQFLFDVSRSLAGPGKTGMAAVLRKAQRTAHPDTGGDAATFQRVALAEAKLREEGLL